MYSPLPKATNQSKSTRTCPVRSLRRGTGTLAQLFCIQAFDSPKNLRGWTYSANALIKGCAKKFSRNRRSFSSLEAALSSENNVTSCNAQARSVGSNRNSSHLTIISRQVRSVSGVSDIGKEDRRNHCLSTNTERSNSLTESWLRLGRCKSTWREKFK